MSIVRLGTPEPVGPEWHVTKRFNFRREYRGHQLVLFHNWSDGWGFGIDACWSTSRFATWEEADQAAKAETDHINDYERSL